MSRFEVSQALEEIRDRIAALEMALLPGNGQGENDWLEFRHERTESALLGLVGAAYAAVEGAKEKLWAEPDVPAPAPDKAPPAASGHHTGRLVQAADKLRGHDIYGRFVEMAEMMAGVLDISDEALAKVATFEEAEHRRSQEAGGADPG